MFITEEECRQILATDLKTHQFQLLNFQITDFHSKFQGLLGDHFTINVEYKENDQPQRRSYFLKTSSQNPFISNFSRELQAYEKETFYYELLKDFAKFGIDNSFAPECYFFKPQIIVLEDLSKTYKGTPRKHFLGYSQCVNCLVALAKFHSSAIIFEKKSGIVLDQKYSAMLQDPVKKVSESFTKRVESAIQAIVGLIDLVPQTRQDFKPNLEKFLADHKPKTGTIFSIVHGDLWTSNFLHRDTDAKLLDFQLVKYGPIESDVVNFLITCTTGQFRKIHFDSLLEFYYQTLDTFLKDSVEITNVTDFIASCHTFCASGRLSALIDQSITFLDNEVYNVIMQTEDSFKQFLYEDRSKVVMETFKNDDVYRQALSEGLLELQDLLS